MITILSFCAVVFALRMRICLFALFILLPTSSFLYLDLPVTRSFALTLCRSFVSSFRRSIAPSFHRSFVPSLLRSVAPSLHRSFSHSRRLKHTNCITLDHLKHKMRGFSWKSMTRLPFNGAYRMIWPKTENCITQNNNHSVSMLSFDHVWCNVRSFGLLIENSSDNWHVRREYSV